MAFVKGKTKYPCDDVATPEHIAKQIIDSCDIILPTSILDPFLGNGVFFNNFPKHTSNFWTEIKKGKDFFDVQGSVDWIISNPPYSIFDEVLTHSYKIADNIVYLVPLGKLWSSMGRLRRLKEYGGIVSINVISAGKCGFPFGFPAGWIHLKRGYKGSTEINIEGKEGRVMGLYISFEKNQKQTKKLSFDELEAITCEFAWSQCGGILEFVCDRDEDYKDTPFHPEEVSIDIDFMKELLSDVEKALSDKKNARKIIKNDYTNDDVFFGRLENLKMMLEVEIEFSEIYKDWEHRCIITM
jgi:hypothetical protein